MGLGYGFEGDQGWPLSGPRKVDIVRISAAVKLGSEVYLYVGRLESFEFDRSGQLARPGRLLSARRNGMGLWLKIQKRPWSLRGCRRQPPGVEKLVRRERQLGCGVDLCFCPFVEGHGRVAVVGMVIEQAIDRRWHSGLPYCRPAGRRWRMDRAEPWAVGVQQAQPASLWCDQPRATEEVDQTSRQGALWWKTRE